MRRMTAAVLSLVMLLALLSGCGKSKAERELENACSAAEAAEAAADRAEADYKDLVDRLEHIQDLQNMLGD